jgi:hypothetical protein
MERPTLKQTIRAANFKVFRTLCGMPQAGNKVGMAWQYTCDHDWERCQVDFVMIFTYDM